MLAEHGQNEKECGETDGTGDQALKIAGDLAESARQAVEGLEKGRTPEMEMQTTSEADCLTGDDTILRDSDTDDQKQHGKRRR